MTGTPDVLPCRRAARPDRPRPAPSLPSPPQPEPSSERRPQ